MNDQPRSSGRETSRNIHARIRPMCDLSKGITHAHGRAARDRRRDRWGEDQSTVFAPTTTGRASAFSVSSVSNTPLPGKHGLGGVYGRVYVRKVMSWDDGFLGARASRPHKACHSPGHLPHLDQPGMAPWLSFGLADAVPADRVAACSIALKLSRGQRDRMRAGRPRSQAMPSRRCRGGCRRATSQKADVHPCGNRSPS